MTLRATSTLALLAALAVGPAGAALAAGASAAPAVQAPAKTPTQAPSRVAPSRANRAASARATKTQTSHAPEAARGRAAARSSAPPARRLEDIPIEGEIAVPQVLFITARDQRRFVDFEHRRYLRTSLQVGETTRFPSWIAVIPSPLPEDIRKETTR